MNKNKLDYLAPQAEPFEVGIERGLCQQSNVRSSNSTRKPYGDVYDFLDELDEEE